MILLHMSFAGAVMVLAVTVIRALFLYKVPKRTFIILWGITLARLLIPFSVPSVFSVYTFFGKNEPVSSNIGNTVTNNFGSVIQESQPTSSSKFIPHFEISIPAWAIIWVIGAIICAVVFLITYWKYYKEFQMSLPLDNDFLQKWLSRHHIKRPLRIRQSQMISAPLTFGIIRPVILMPKTTDWTDERTLQYVLAHEFVHIRRFDSLSKVILLIALCVHWFNPFVWIMYILANRDIELSCDEAVLCLFGEDRKASYAQMLICMEETKSGFIPFCNSFSKNAIEERMVAIMKTKKRTLVSMGLAVCLIAGTTIAFATSAAAGESELPIAVDASMGLTYTVDGKTFHVDENGNTLDEAEYEKETSGQVLDVEWWTYEEYKDWLENEKKELSLMVGTKGRANGKEFVWTQEMIDAAIASYEETLQDIKNGVMHSKTVNGSIGFGLVMQNGEVAIQQSNTDD